MKSGEIYIFTVRSHINAEPRITQERIYVSLFEFKLIKSLDLLFSAEKDKKKANKELMKTYKTEMYKLSHNKEAFEVFSDNSVYVESLNKFKQTYEGWYNLKLK